MYNATALNIYPRDTNEIKRGAVKRSVNLPFFLIYQYTNGREKIKKRRYEWNNRIRSLINRYDYCLAILLSLKNRLPNTLYARKIIKPVNTPSMNNS